MLRCPGCTHQVVALVREGEANCIMCGTRWVPRERVVSPAPATRGHRFVTPDPKPRRRIVDADAGVEKVKREGRCRVCKARGVYSSEPNPYGHVLLTRHHTVPKSAGGDDVDDNIGPVCGDGTVGCHSDIEEYRAGAREAYRLAMTPSEVAYVTARKSLAWLDRHYPEPGGSGKIEARP